MNLAHPIRIALLSASVGWPAACASSPATAPQAPVTGAEPAIQETGLRDHKQQVIQLLKSLETGDPAPLAVINPGKYVQHNLAVADGPEGVRSFVASLPRGTTKVHTVRVIQDGDFVVAHTEYNLFGPKIGFDVFRYEGEQIVEHWDNLQETAARPSPSGHTMTDGPTTVSDLDKTDANKALMTTYMDDLLQGRKEKFASYYDGNNYIQHSPQVGDGLTGLFAGLQALAKQGLAVKYTSVKRILGEGNFVMVISEGTFGDKTIAFYDYYRIQDGKIAEHWDVLEPIPPRASWKNPNGKF